VKSGAGGAVIWSVLGLVLTAALTASWVRPPAEARVEPVVLYQAPGCGCCGAYSEYLRGRGYSVRVVRTPELSAVKRRLGVPQALWSCHTAVVGRYFVEGHVPVEALARLLRRAPDWRGVALPGMPAGSPGMDGPRRGPLVVYGVTADGRWTEFARL